MSVNWLAVPVISTERMNSRVLMKLAAVPVALAAVLLACGPAEAASVTTLSGAQGWRVSPFNAGTVAISTAVDEDGTLKLDNRAGGARAQAQLPLHTTLADVMNHPIGYRVFVACGAEPRFGANLQIEILSPHYTTLSFQPQLAGDLELHSWESFFSNRSAKLWWSSRAFGPIASNTPVSLNDILAAQGSGAQVINAYLNVSAHLNVHVNDVELHGVHYVFRAPNDTDEQPESPGEEAGDTAGADSSCTGSATGPTLAQTGIDVAPWGWGALGLVAAGGVTQAAMRTRLHRRR